MRESRRGGGGTAMTRSIQEGKENSPPPKHTKKSKTDGLVRKRGGAMAIRLLCLPVCVREPAGVCSRRRRNGPVRVGGGRGKGA